MNRLGIAALALLIAFSSGFTAGGMAVYKRWKVSELQAANKKLLEDYNRFRAALGFSEELDAESDKINTSNEAIVDAIRKRAPKPDTKPSGVPDVDSDPICIDADSMRDIERIN